MDWGTILEGALQQGLGPAEIVYCLSGIGLILY